MKLSKAEREKSMEFYDVYYLEIQENGSTYEAIRNLLYVLKNLVLFHMLLLISSP